MNKPKRTATIASFIIKKLKNISIASSNPNSSVDVHTETVGVNLNQHAINRYVSEMTISLVGPKNNRLIH